MDIKSIKSKFFFDNELPKILKRNDVLENFDILLGSLKIQKAFKTKAGQFFYTDSDKPYKDMKSLIKEIKGRLSV